MNTLDTTIEELRNQRAELMDQMRLLDEAIESLEKIVGRTGSAGGRITIVPPSRAPRSRREGPGTTEAILTILREADRPLHDIEILELMDKRGWAPPSRTPLNALRASLSRLRRTTPPTIVRRSRDGAYVLPRESEAPSEAGGS